MTYTMTLPGKFLRWMDGTGIGQHQPDDDADSQALYSAFHSMTIRKVGKGQQGIITLPTLGAVSVLMEYAEAGYDANHPRSSEYGDRGEMLACEKVVGMCREVLA